MDFSRQSPARSAIPCGFWRGGVAGSLIHAVNRRIGRQYLAASTRIDPFRESGTTAAPISEPCSVSDAREMQDAKIAPYVDRIGNSRCKLSRALPGDICGGNDMGRNSALLNLLFLVMPMLIGLSVLTLFPWVRSSPPTALLVAESGYLLGFGLFASAKVATIRDRKPFSWGSAAMTTSCRLRYRFGYALMGFAAIVTLCLALPW